MADVAGMAGSAPRWCSVRRLNRPTVARPGRSVTLGLLLAAGCDTPGSYVLRDAGADVATVSDAAMVSDGGNRDAGLRMDATVPADGSRGDAAADDTGACGVIDHLCCGGTGCTVGLACRLGTCHPGAFACGGSGEPCCDGNTCSAGLTCAAGTCGSGNGGGDAGGA